MPSVKTNETLSLEIIQERLGNIQHDIHEIKEDMKTRFVTQDQFRPVMAIVYGLVALSGGGVVAAILALVLKDVSGADVP